MPSGFARCEQAFRRYRAARDFHHLVARLCAPQQFHIAQRHRKQFRDETQQRLIGAALYRRGGKAYLQRIAVQARNFTALGAGLRMNHQDNRAAFAAVP